MTDKLTEARPGLSNPVKYNEPSVAPPPARYTQAVRDVIVDRVRNGLGPAEAATIAGLRKQEFYTWKKLASEGNLTLQALFDDIEKAQSEHEYELIREVHDNDRHQDPLAVLERLYGKRWSQKIQHMVDSELQEAVKRLEHEFMNEPVIWNRILGCLAREA